MSRKTNHLLAALKSIAAAQEELEHTVSNNGKIIEGNGAEE